MAKELTNDEPFPDGIRRIAGEMVDALIEIVEHEEDIEVAIHTFRKGCKEIRALLRLVRDDLGETCYQLENAFYRDLARPFSERRDRWVFIETIDEVLTPEDSAEHDPIVALLQTTRNNLLADYTQRYADRIPDSFDEVAAKLTEAKKRIADWLIDDQGFASIRKSIRRIYERGRSTMAIAAAEPDAETRHKWRKLVKYLWYQLRTLRQIAPEAMESIALDWYELSSLLGVDHDLSELINALSNDPELAGGPENIRTIEKVIIIHQEELETQIYTLAERLYLDDADSFVNRLGKYWSTAGG